VVGDGVTTMKADVGKDNCFAFSCWNRVYYSLLVLKYENKCSTAAAEINKLQLFNVPLKVLITYQPGNLDALLTKYAKMVQAADVFNDFSTLRRQLVIFGFCEGGKARWRAFLYGDGVFREHNVLATSSSGL